MSDPIATLRAQLAGALAAAEQEVATTQTKIDEHVVAIAAVQSERLTLSDHLGGVRPLAAPLQAALDDRDREIGRWNVELKERRSELYGAQTRLQALRLAVSQIGRPSAAEDAASTAPPAGE